jgi:hypothetical protein
MKESRLDAGAKVRIIFGYFKQEREEFVDAKPISSPSSKTIRQDNLYIGFMILLTLVGLLYGLFLL